MNGMILSPWVSVSVVAITLVITGCKNGRSSTTGAEASEPEPQSTGTMSLTGMYSYMADAASFVDCATGARWPVATEEDNAALERAYLRHKPGPGEPLRVEVEGRVEPRPKIDHPGVQPTLIVERFVGAWPGMTCEKSSVPLEETHWVLVELRGSPVEPGPNQAAPHLELHAKKASAYGFGGCNRFFGSYQSSGDTLELGPLGATRMACPEGMDREQELFRALESVNRYEIRDSALLLYAEDQLVARFEARARVE